MFSKRKELDRWTYDDWAIVVCERLSDHPNEPKQKVWILHFGEPVAEYYYKWNGRKFVAVIKYLVEDCEILALIRKTAHKAAKLLAKHFEINEDVCKAITDKLEYEIEIFEINEAKQKNSQQPTLTPAVR